MTHKGVLVKEENLPDVLVGRAGVRVIDCERNGERTKGQVNSNDDLEEETPSQLYLLRHFELLTVEGSVLVAGVAANEVNPLDVVLHVVFQVFGCWT